MLVCQLNLAPSVESWTVDCTQGASDVSRTDLLSATLKKSLISSTKTEVTGQLRLSDHSHPVP